MMVETIGLERHKYEKLWFDSVGFIDAFGLPQLSHQQLRHRRHCERSADPFSRDHSLRERQLREREFDG